MRPSRISKPIALSLSVLLASWTTAKSDQAAFAESQIVPPDTLLAQRPATTDDTYYLTMTLPAGNSFARLSFTEQNSGTGAEPVPFDLPKTQAFAGVPKSAGQPIAIRDTWVDETGTLWVEFEGVVAAKTIMTIAFQMRQKPSRTAYEYAIAAYPAISNPVAVYVGNAVLMQALF